MYFLIRTLLKNISNIFGNTKKVLLFSIVIIITISYGLFFYLQDNIENNLRNQLFEQQEKLQIESTIALSRHIGSDLDSIMARLQMLANSDLLQQGDFSSNKTVDLLEKTYTQISTVTPISRLLLLNADNIATINIISPEGLRETFVGFNFSSFNWVQETKATETPVFSNAYQGIRTNENRIAVTYPIINRETGEYLGLVATPIPTIPFFRYYGNIYDINSQYVAALDRDSVSLIHPVESFIGEPFFGNHTQETVGHNKILNNLITTVMSGGAESAVYEFNAGERLTTGLPIFVQGKPQYFVFAITPTATFYSEINDIVLMQSIQTFALLAGTSAAIIVLIFFLIKWNSNLNREVKRRTTELDESNKQLVQANEQLKVHEKMQKEFVNVAAHELRTPVQPILGLSSVLLSKIKDSEQHYLVNVIFRNAKRLGQLTENVLDVTRIESQLFSLKRERFNLNDVIIDCVNDMTVNKNYFHGGKKDVKISYQRQKDSFEVEADKTRIIQVISNILSNAIKFSPQHGGTISISLEKEIVVDDDDEGKANRVIVSIKDNGPGIDSELFPKLFSRFTSKSFSGTGLGLFISKNIIEAHGGRIWAQNNHDGEKGATFSFSLLLRE
jgi:signal transduction histidine kinase